MQIYIFDLMIKAFILKSILCVTHPIKKNSSQNNYDIL